MAFANAIGGVQADYPDSAGYGPAHFDPPVVITGEKQVEKFTWIRGAHKVTIGPRETQVEWWGWHTLVIPKLRIKAGNKVPALMIVPEVTISISQPFVCDAMQFADGRHVGGVRLLKRHPDWKPTPEKEIYNLWVRVIDGHTRRAIPEAEVKLFGWNGGDAPDSGQFVEEAQWYTNGMGIVDAPGLACAERKLLLVKHTPWLPHARRFRPLPGQTVRFTFRLWQNKRLVCPYRWRAGDSVQALADLSGAHVKSILDMNHLSSPDEIKPGQLIEIPCFEGAYRAQERDTLARLAEWFCYEEKTLAELNGLQKSCNLFIDQEIRLPDWRFVIARPGDRFAALDEQFGLPRGWSRPVQRTLHDQPAMCYPGEAIAIPIAEFAQKHSLRPWTQSRKGR